MQEPCAEGTRGAFYARRHGGGWRAARKEFTCQQALCLRKIKTKDKYFDTCEVTAWPKTKRICAACAQEVVK